jgi:Spy/CpxP family protein refolding chaperone
MGSVKIWKWLVGILALLNIILMISIWRKPQHSRPPMPEGGPAKMIIEELRLDPDQVKAFEKLKDEHHSAVVDLQRKGKELRDGLFDLLKQEHADSSEVKRRMAEIGENQVAIEKVTFEHFQKVRQLCDAEQKKRFDAMINDVLRRMAGPHHEHDEPPPPPR